jgi:copper(I)-binding protein
MGLLFTGCAATNLDSATPNAKPAVNGETIAITDPWVRAETEGASAVFGTFTNNGTNDATIVSASTAAANSVELHETVKNGSNEIVMRTIEGGYVIPAGGSLTLEPNGNHIMLTDLVEPLATGEEVNITLTFSDKFTLTFKAPVKEYSGGNGNYSQ